MQLRRHFDFSTLVLVLRALIVVKLPTYSQRKKLTYTRERINIHWGHTTYTFVVILVTVHILVTVYISLEAISML